MTKHQELLKQAVKYPLELRIAAKFYLDGWNEEEFAVENWTRLPEPLINTVMNQLRDIERKQTPLTDELKLLANRL